MFNLLKSKLPGKIKIKKISGSSHEVLVHEDPKTGREEFWSREGVILGFIDSNGNFISNEIESLIDFGKR
jgi:hypothetical protein